MFSYIQIYIDGLHVFLHLPTHCLLSPSICSSLAGAKSLAIAVQLLDRNRNPMTCQDKPQGDMLDEAFTVTGTMLDERSVALWTTPNADCTATIQVNISTQSQHFVDAAEGITS